MNEAERLTALGIPTQQAEHIARTLRGDPKAAPEAAKKAVVDWMAEHGASLHGATGDRGLRGYKGDKGDQGEPGRDGDPGPKGEPGSNAPALASQVGTATISQTATLALSAGVRTVSVPVAGVVPAGNYMVFASGAVPAGYGIMHATCTTAGTLQVTITAPLLAIGANYSIPVRVVRINT